MCDLPDCFAYSVKQIQIPDCAIEVWIGYQSGRPFSALIRDGRKPTKIDHFHFPAGDVTTLAAYFRRNKIR